jgi:acyl-CoA thioester hydrolase
LSPLLHWGQARDGANSMSQKFEFYHPLRVRFIETDAQGHVFFGHYLNYFDVGLIEYTRAIGYSYPDMVATGVDMFYVEASCQYKGRAYFDDVLHVHTRIGPIGNTSFTFEFAIYKQPTEELIATGEVVAVAVDAETGRPVRVPDALRDAVARFEKVPVDPQKEER